MSQENVEIALKLFRTELGEVAELVHPECTVTPAEGWPEPGPFVGRDACMREFERLFADWSEWRFEDIRVLANPDDWVVLAWRWHTRGVTSGIEADFNLATAFRFRDGRVVESHFRWRAEDALEAAGLE
jgi:ketosteroid isomerase-like protein